MNQRYQILYAAPMWSYARCSKVSYKYPPIYSVNKMKALNVPKLAEENSLLFMWANTKQLSDAIELGEAWGFKYITIAFVWDKMFHNPATYTMQQCEFCLLFRKGKMPKLNGNSKVRQLVSCRRDHRFQKPHKIRHLIQQMFPTLNKVQLFFDESHEDEAWNRIGFKQILEI